jgi:hypothetical protein
MQLGSYHLSKLRTEMHAVKFVSPPLTLRSKFSYSVCRLQGMSAQPLRRRCDKLYTMHLHLRIKIIRPL